MSNNDDIDKMKPLRKKLRARLRAQKNKRTNKTNTEDDMYKHIQSMSNVEKNAMLKKMMDMLK